MTITAQQRIDATLRQPAIYVSRKGVAFTSAAFLASLRPTPVSLPKPLPERSAT